MGPNDPPPPDDEDPVVDSQVSTDTGGDPPTGNDPPTVNPVPTRREPAVADRRARASALLAPERERYRLGDVIGKGGMGEVVAAHDAQIGRAVAIKRMRKPQPSETDIDRFLREARIQGRLDHPAIVPVYELARDRDGRPFFAMKRLAGTALAAILSGHAKRDPVMLERFPRQRLLRALADVCLAVEFAHNRGVIHRDLKPANIMLGDFGEVYVMDWGIARIIDDDADVAVDDESVSGPGGVSSSSTSTQVGAMLGTPGYMPPEQIRGEARLDGRVDVYALGCVLFEILAGGLPLHPRGDAGVDSAITGVEARLSLRASDREIAPELEALCVAATARDRDARLATARALGERIQRFLDGDRDLARRRDLARDHLGRATAALAGGAGEDAERTAMREAGRALALDPTLTDAADLVGRLMLEPPRETPPEIERVIEAEDRASIGRFARISAVGYLGYLAFIPVILAIGIRDARYVWAMLAIVAVNMALSWVGIRGGMLRIRPAAVVVVHIAMIVLLTRMFSFLVAPGAAAVTLMALVANPSYRKTRTTILVMVGIALAILVPLAAEGLGLLSRTMTLAGEDLMLHSPAVRNHDGWTQLSLVLWTVLVVLIAGSTARTMARAERDARHRLHLHAWRLRQLMPDPAAGLATGV